MMRTGHAERQARYRNRQILGLTLVTVEVSHDHINTLIDGGYLAEDLSEDRQAVATAITRVLEQR